MTGSGPGVSLVTGAGNGIGNALVRELLNRSGSGMVLATCRSPDRAEALKAQRRAESRLKILQLDLTNEASLSQLTAEVARVAGRLDLVINTAGVLHSPSGMRPERRLSEIEAGNLLCSFDVNALGALRLAQATEGLLKASARACFTSLTARVGSISDNRLGGWYAYRASKAALNMMIKTLAIEWSRLRPPIVCAALHPGTVSTDLSAPFIRHKEGAAIFTPDVAASKLLDVISRLEPDKSGGFYAWDGSVIPW